MVKVRLQGLPDEVAQLLESMREDYRVLEVRGPYKNRNGEYVRVYLEVKNGRRK